jgi:tetratricopeptide (TPR) repeat protein
MLHCNRFAYRRICVISVLFHQRSIEEMAMRLRNAGLALAGLAALLLLGAVWALPPAARILPARVQAQIPDRLWALVETPLPTALPAARVTAVPIAADLFQPVTSTPTAVSAPLPTFTPSAAEVAPPTPTPIPPTPTPVPSPTPTGAPPSASRIDGFRIIAQTFNNCGPANLTMALNYFGHNVHQADVSAIVNPIREDANVNPWELVAYTNAHTPLTAEYFAGGDLDLLKRLIAAGFPVIVEKGYQPSERLGWMGHYLTLVGYDDARQAFTAMDSYLGPWDSRGLHIAYEDLHTYWQQFNHTFIVVHPPQKSAQAAAILGPAMLDREAMWRQAGQKAQTAITADPNNAFAWFNLGTNLVRLGQLTSSQVYFDNAAAAYDQARAIGLPWRMLWYQFDIYEAYLAAGRYEDVIALANLTVSGAGDRIIEESFLYRGHAYLALGNPAQARLDYRRALALNPNFAAAQAALKEALE